MEEEELFYTRPELKELSFSKVFFGNGGSSCTIGGKEDSDTGTEAPMDPDDPQT